jgi:hypothetical protein
MGVSEVITPVPLPQHDRSLDWSDSSKELWKEGVPLPNSSLMIPFHAGRAYFGILLQGHCKQQNPKPSF